MQRLCGRHQDLPTQQRAPQCLQGWPCYPRGVSLHPGSCCARLIWSISAGTSGCFCSSRVASHPLAIAVAVWLQVQGPACSPTPSGMPARAVGLLLWCATACWLLFHAVWQLTDLPAGLSSSTALCSRSVTPVVPAGHLCSSRPGGCLQTSLCHFYGWPCCARQLLSMCAIHCRRVVFAIQHTCLGNELSAASFCVQNRPAGLLCILGCSATQVLRELTGVQGCCNAPQQLHGSCIRCAGLRPLRGSLAVSVH